MRSALTHTLLPDALSGLDNALFIRADEGEAFGHLGFARISLSCGEQLSLSETGVISASLACREVEKKRTLLFLGAAAGANQRAACER
mmetsp:Transcript_2032/g.5341  ORF Transcript_2032/g.5341 Transcript_2032/m.5341 type:complete len:88 (-) Transcript_2032:176-439(-)